MKANQKFSTADEAVSPVIGVILMVAITVVLAAVVFVLVQDLGSGAESAPGISLQKQTSGTNSVWTVVKISNGPLDYAQITASCTTTTIVQSATSGTVGAGDSFTCPTGETLKIVHDATETLLFNQD